MAIKGTRATQIANNTNVSPVKFNFKPYAAGNTYYNNTENIDFVTWEGNLYVTVNDGTEYAEGDPTQNGFLLLVAKGEDGAVGATGEQGPAGHAPRITAKFEGNQVTIYADGTRIAATNDLTPPSWRPELVNHTIVWNKTKDDTVPQPIDLDSLRTSERPVIFRVDSDNTKRDDEESGPAKFIQWKYEGDEDWRNLISIDELMNVALAGISFWTDNEDGGAWHFGHREVVSATYDVKEEGGRSIAKVELGDVLFDAGRIPFANYELEFAEVQQDIAEIREALENFHLDPADLDGYLTEARADVLYARTGQLANLLTRQDADGYYQPVGNYALRSEIPSTAGLLRQTDADARYAKISDIPDTSNFLTVNDLPLDGDAITDIGFEVVENTFRYHVQKNNTWGNWLSIPISTLLDDNCIKNVSYDDNNHRLEFTWEDNQTVRIDLSDLLGNNGVTETRVGELIDAALQNLPSGGSTVTVTPTLNSGTEIGRITVDGNTTVLYAPTGSNGTISGIKLNANTSVLPIQNGIVTLNIADNPIIDIKIEDGILYKKAYTDSDWISAGVVPSGSTGEGLTEAQVRTLITAELENLNLNNFLTKTQADNLYSKVNLQQILSSGTKIATVTVDGTPVDLYAPSGNSGTPSDPTDPSYSISYRTFTVYQRTDSCEIAPSTNTITSATWNATTNDLTLVSQYWTNHPENKNIAQGKIYLWMTSAAFNSDTRSIVGDWEYPICLTGRDGSEGKDGKDVEFVYYRNDGEIPTLNQNIGLVPTGMIDPTTRRYERKTSASYEDFLPSDNLAGSFLTDLNGRPIPQWTDNPRGLDGEEYFYEWVSIRHITRDSNNQPVYGEFSAPAIWSKWGEDGMDGDGVEYIFRLASENDVVVENGQILLKQTVARPNNNWNYDSPVSPWTDEPSGVNQNNPYEFCSLRKTLTEDNDKVWGPWSEPALWAHYAIGQAGPAGPAGDQYEYVFARANTEIPTNAFVDLISSDNTTTLTLDSTEYQTDRYLPKFRFTFVDSTSLSVRCTASPTGISSEHCYEFEAFRRKHNGVWTNFSSPALRANFVAAGLTEEELNEIKEAAAQAAQGNISSALSRLDAAEQAINAARNTLDNLESITDGLTTTTNSLTGRVQTIEGWTVYDEADIKAFAGQVLDAGKASIISTANSYTDGKITTVNNTLDAINGTISSITDRLDEDENTLTTVGTRLSSAEGDLLLFADWKNNTTNTLNSVSTDLNALDATISSHATRLQLAENSVTNVQSDLNALEGNLTNTVSNSRYLMNESGEFVDSEGNVLGKLVKDCANDAFEIVKHGLGSGNSSNWDFVVKSYLDSSTNKYIPIYQRVTITNNCISNYTSTWFDANMQPLTLNNDGTNVVINGSNKPILTGLNVMVLIVDALSQIKQTAGEIDLTAINGDQAAQILLKANQSSSSITLQADKIHLHGDVSAQSAAIDNVWIKDARITNGTISNATIADCTITSSLRSSNYDNQNHTGFLLDQTGDFALYSTSGTKFDSVNGLTLGQNQTISWNNVSNKPNIPEDLSDLTDTNNTLSTFITRDSLITNKITANEIDASNLHVSAANIDGTISATKVLVKDSDNTVSGGLISQNSNNTETVLINGTAYPIGSVRLWAGVPSQGGDMSNVPFRVTNDGHLYATNATISGDVTANKITVTNGNTTSALQIVFGDVNMTTDSSNTLYFLYNQTT